jgi:hypothetical protein
MQFRECVTTLVNEGGVLLCVRCRALLDETQQLALAVAWLRKQVGCNSCLWASCLTNVCWRMPCCAAELRQLQ